MCMELRYDIRARDIHVGVISIRDGIENQRTAITRETGRERREEPEYCTPVEEAEKGQKGRGNKESVASQKHVNQVYQWGGSHHPCQTPLEV